MPTSVIRVIPTGTEHILFVDDEKVIVELSKKYLISLGYSVKARTSSFEALELFKSMPDKFDLVITDMILPVKGGLKMISDLIRAYPGIKIIAISGGGAVVRDFDYLEYARALGAVECFHKPVDPQELLETIEAVL